MDQQLSPQAQNALAAVTALSLEDQVKVVSLASLIVQKLSTAKPEKLARAQSAVEASIAAQQLTIEQMKRELSDADCLYNDPGIWEKLGAVNVPKIPDSVIREAHEMGGRVILRCSSISKKANALRAAGHSVYFVGSGPQHYTENVLKPRWIVVQSRIDGGRLHRPRSEVVTSDPPDPTPEEWLSVIAYARLDGGRQPQDCGSVYRFRTDSGMMAAITIP